VAICAEILVEPKLLIAGNFKRQFSMQIPVIHQFSPLEGGGGGGVAYRNYTGEIL
jgi:hypothetical protein